MSEQTASKTSTETRKVVKAPQVNRPSRLYVKGRFVGYRRDLVKQREHQSLIAVQDVASKREAKFYIGKRIAYVYKVSKKRHSKPYKVIWGKIIASHGNNGLVRAKFRSNLPAKAMGNAVRIMLYPSNI